MKQWLILSAILPLIYCLGEPESIPVDDAVHKVISFALYELNAKKEFGAERSLSDVHIISAEKQLVNGFVYNIKFEVEDGKEVKECDVKVYETFQKVKKLEKYVCHPKTSKLGGEKDALLDDDVQKAVDAAVKFHNMHSNNMFLSKPQAVTDVKTQTVEGKLYKFSVRFVDTVCSKDGSGMAKNVNDCPVNTNGLAEVCTFKVQYRSWKKKQYEVNPVQECKPAGQASADTAEENIKAQLAEKLQNVILTPDKTLPLLGLTEGNKPKQETANDNIKAQLAEKLKNAILSPDQTLPLFELTKENKDNLVKQIDSAVKNPHYKNEIEPLAEHIGQGLFQAFTELSSKHLLGGDGHDQLPHGHNDGLIGGGDHDYKPHGSNRGLLGLDDYDKIPHGHQKLIGGGNHDYQPDEKNGLLGRDGHDYKPHSSNRGKLGGDDHDLKPHGKQGILGGDDHDYKPHGGQVKLGGDDHDKKPHGKVLCHRAMFKEFQLKYNRTYLESDEEDKRFKIFCENMEIVEQLNSNEQGTATYGATKFADLSPSEFKKIYLSKTPWDQIPNYGKSMMYQAKIPPGSPPKAFDWRDHGAVSPVKNQGSCGSCWAFSTTGNIEGQWKINRGQLLSLSEQELVDCDKLDDGCNGGLPSNAYVSIMKLGGLETESEYKYDGVDEKCKFDKSEARVSINGAVNISSNEDDMAAWLAENEPISIGINAMAMQFYFGGISHPFSIFCSPKSIDHGVLIVGYGVEGSEPYWIVKNSWGEDWGEKGYYLVYRGDGVCGLNTMCTSAVVKKA